MRRSSSVMMRPRSACDSRMLSNSGRNRTGAGRSGSGSGAPGTSNSSWAGAVPEGAQPVPQTVEHGPQPGQPRPELHVLDGGRAVCRQITQHHLLEGEPVRQRLAEPGLGGGVPRPAAHSPDPARRHLHQRQQRARRVRQMPRRHLGPALLQRLAQLRGRQRRLGQRGACGGGQFGRIHHPVHRLAGPAAHPQIAVQGRLGQRAERAAVLRRDEMHRAAHHSDTGQGAVLQGTRQIPDRKPVQTGPQADVRRVGCLGLESDEPGHRVENAQLMAPQQQLARQQGTVEGAGAEDGSAVLAVVRAAAHAASGWPSDSFGRGAGGAGPLWTGELASGSNRARAIVGAAREPLKARCSARCHPPRMPPSSSAGRPPAGTPPRPAAVPPAAPVSHHREPR